MWLADRMSPLLVSYNLDQACTTYGPRAKCGPRKLLIWPAKPQIVFSLLVSLIKTPFEWVNSYQLWPLDMSKKKLVPMRFELCTSGLDECTYYALRVYVCIFLAKKEIGKKSARKD